MDDPHRARNNRQPRFARPDGRSRHASFARKSGADEEPWVVIGLDHDVDCDEHPDEHLRHAPEILRFHGWPEEYVRAVASHGWGQFTDAAPVTDLEKTLFAIDELTGLVAAAALVRPSRKRFGHKI